MFVRLMQAMTITMALYVLLGLNTLETRATNSTVEPAEALVALKQALLENR
ncbi:MAG: hypothetical protein WBD47_00235 [Phormidesmis sp.]